MGKSGILPGFFPKDICTPAVRRKGRAPAAFFRGPDRSYGADMRLSPALKRRSVAALAVSRVQEIAQSELKHGTGPRNFVAPSHTLFGRRFVSKCPADRVWRALERAGRVFMFACLVPCLDVASPRISVPPLHAVVYLKGPIDPLHLLFPLRFAPAPRLPRLRFRRQELGTVAVRYSIPPALASTATRCRCVHLCSPCPPCSFTPPSAQTIQALMTDSPTTHHTVSTVRAVLAPARVSRPGRVSSPSALCVSHAVAVPGHVAYGVGAATPTVMHTSTSREFGTCFRSCSGT